MGCPARTATAQIRSARHLHLIAIVFALTSIHCDAADTAREKVVEDHREHAQGKVGVLRALEVKEQAVGIIRDSRALAQPACTLPKAPFVATVTLKASAPQGESEARLTDVRHIVADARGNGSATYEIAWTEATARGETWTREERVVDGHLYVREQNLPFVRHTRRPGALIHLLDRALDGVRTGLHLGEDRWSGGPETWKLGPPGGHRFDGCRPEASAGWLERLSRTSTLREASAETTDGRRRFRGTWLRENGQLMTLDIVEEIRNAPQEIKAPTNLAEGSHRDIQHDTS